MTEKEPNMRQAPDIFDGKIEDTDDITLEQARQIFGFKPNDHLLMETIREKYYELSLKWVRNDDAGRKNLAVIDRAMDILKMEFMKNERA
ncbi:MAG: hypothetical protein V1867_01345 [Candidatus Falkowbacteria bacterium]